MIPYGEGWPFPKKERRSGTVYRLYDDPMRDSMLIVAIDLDGTRRAVEIHNKLWCAVLRPRDRFRGEGEQGVSLSSDEDFETLLQAPEAWTTNRPVPFERLARILFELDFEADVFIFTKAENCPGCNECKTDLALPIPCPAALRHRDEVARVAYARREPVGCRERAEDLASKILHRLATPSGGTADE